MKLIDLLNEIANEYECEVVEGNEFAYYYAENLIVVDTADTDETFKAFAVANGLNADVNAFVISFFHELGHNETIDDVDEYEGDKNALTTDEYYALEEEWVATEWAIDFCNTHTDIVKEIEKFL